MDNVNQKEGGKIFRTDGMFMINKIFFTHSQVVKKWMLMKGCPLIVFMPVMILSCITVSGLSDNGIRRELYSVRKEILSRRDEPVFLKDRRVGETGYFYIISVQGVVVYHPSSILVGRSFADLDFIRQVIEKQEGVLRYGREGLRFRVYFTPLDKENILCLSIQEKEIQS